MGVGPCNLPHLSPCSQATLLVPNAVAIDLERLLGALKDASSLLLQKIEAGELTVSLSPHPTSSLPSTERSFFTAKIPTYAFFLIFLLSQGRNCHEGSPKAARCHEGKGRGGRGRG